MDVEQIKKRQTIKVFITEAIMVFSIIGLVVFLMMIASGYWINQDFTVERQGLLQYASIPSGADVAIDGETGWMQKTNNSKMVSSGEHTVTISKEGYDSWTKKVNIEEGLLYRVVYPRLFLQNRTTEKVRELGDVRYATVSPKGDKILALKDNMTFEVALIDSSEFKLNELDISGIYSNTYKIEEILSADWSGDDEKVLMNVQISNVNGESLREWTLLNAKHPEKSVRISKTFDLDIADIKFIDDSADNLLVLERADMFKNQLRKINLSSQSISAVLVDDVSNINVFGSDIIFIDGQSPFRNATDGTISIYKDNKIESLVSVPNVYNAFAQESEFYNNRYLSVVSNNEVSLYEMSDFISGADELKKVLDETISFYPTEFKLEKEGDFLFMKDGKKIAVLDMESEKIIEYEIENENYGWLDGHMIYTVDDAGTLIVYDYDGLNRRELVQNVSREFGAVINERWLYYVSNGWLIRENLLPE